MNSNVLFGFLKEKLKTAMKIRNEALLERLDSWAGEVARGAMDAYGDTLLKDFRHVLLMERNVKLREALEAIQSTLKLRLTNKVVIDGDLAEAMLKLIAPALDERVKDGEA